MQETQLDPWVRNICWRRDSYPFQFSWTSLVAQLVKRSTCSAGDLSFLPGLERSPGEGNGYIHQYSGLENSKERGAWQAKVQLSSETQSCPTLCNFMDCSMPGLNVHHKLVEISQTYVHWLGDAIQLSHSLLSPSPPAINLSQHQGLFKWVSSSHQVAKVLEFQLQHQSLQWIFRTDFL